jgi:cation:H+ antiporter
LLTYVLFVVGFVLLVKGADFLVEGASGVARRLRVSDLVIGLTVVAFGTSAPELIVNLYAGVTGSTEIAVGNVLGSNIANILLILGVSAVIYPLAVGKGTAWKEIPLSLLAAAVLFVLANDAMIDGRQDSALTRIDGLVLLAFFAVFIYYALETARRERTTDAAFPGSAPVAESPSDEVKERSVLRLAVLLALGLAGLFFGASWVVDGAVAFASAAGMSQKLIGLTIVALGTSLPELATSATAALKKNAEIAVGNVVGSNIFNIFFILGVGATVSPLPFQGSANIDMGVVIFASVLLFAFVFAGKGRRIDRREGIVFLLLYAGYIAFLIVRG